MENRFNFFVYLMNIYHIAFLQPQEFRCVVHIDFPGLGWTTQFICMLLLLLIIPCTVELFPKIPPVPLPPGMQNSFVRTCMNCIVPLLVRRSCANCYYQYESLPTGAIIAAAPCDIWTGIHLCTPSLLVWQHDKMVGSLQWNRRRLTGITKQQQRSV